MKIEKLLKTCRERIQKGGNRKMIEEESLKDVVKKRISGVIFQQDIEIQEIM